MYRDTLTGPIVTVASQNKRIYSSTDAPRSSGSPEFSGGAVK